MSLLLTALLLLPADYPRPELLIEAAELAKPEARARLRVLDARARGAYDKGHVPGAVRVDANAWSAKFANTQDPSAWAKEIGDLGIDENTSVVVYDDAATGGARVWWILRALGVKEVRLLNGGWAAWTAAKGAVGTDEAKPEAKTPKLTPPAARLATKQDVLDLLKKPDRQIVDARSEGEYCGEQKTAAKAGAIPGAVHLEWSDLLDPKTRRFKSPDEMAQLFKERHIRLDRPSVTYCQSGGRASVMAFALELMGAKEVRNYYKSWQEWGNAADTPVEKPAPPKK